MGIFSPVPYCSRSRLDAKVYCLSSADTALFKRAARSSHFYGLIYFFLPLAAEFRGGQMSWWETKCLGINHQNWRGGCGCRWRNSSRGRRLLLLGSTRQKMGQIAGCERNVPVSVKESHRLLSLSIMTCFLEFCTEILFEHLRRPCNGTTTSNRRKQDIIPGRTMEMPVISPLTLLCLPHDSAGLRAHTHQRRL